MKKYADYKNNDLTELDSILNVIDPNEENSILEIIETIDKEENERMKVSLEN